MAYDKSTDLNNIQFDVLTGNLGLNEKIKGLNKLKTVSQTVVRAINELFSTIDQAKTQAGIATDAATEAKQGVETAKTEIQESVQSIVKETITQKMTEIVSGGIQNDEFYCEDNQTAFTLSKTPADKDNILFYVNGVKYTKEDYRYNEADNTVEWLNVAVDEKHPQPFALKVTDVVSMVYISK